jgi:hypothetical protein
VSSLFEPFDLRRDAHTIPNLSRLFDLEAIKTLRIVYGHLLDGHRLDRIDEVFAADAVCDLGQGLLCGLIEIRAALAQAFIEYDTEHRGSFPFLHAVTNHWIEFIDADTAQGRCYLIDLHTVTKTEREPWILLGSYADEYTRIDGQWRITRSQLDVFWPSRNAGGGLPGDGLVLP